MAFIKCSKTQTALLSMLFCLTVAFFPTLSRGLANEEPGTALPNMATGPIQEQQSFSTSNSDPNDSVQPENPKEIPETNPNSQPDEDEAEDPNSPALSIDSEENNDDFSPKVSTLITINNAYEKILSPEIITTEGLVHYSTLRRKREDIIIAARELEKLNPAVLMSLSKEQRIAFWINTYNVCTLKLIVDNYPIEPKLYMIFYPNNSIMQITGDWRKKHFFDIQGLEYTLEEIEQEFLLARHNDPRILFTLSYASLGGAMLRNEPYVSDKLNEQLDEQVRRYLMSPRGLQIDKEKGIVHLSNLFTMLRHKEFFLSSEYASIKKFRDRKPEEQAWLNFSRNYLPEEDIRYLETATFDIKFMKYDWLLNETP